MPETKIDYKSVFIPMYLKSVSGLVKDTYCHTLNRSDEITYGDNFPDWRDRIKRGLDATTLMDGTRNVIKLRSGFYQHPLGPNAPTSYQNSYTIFLGVLRYVTTADAGHVSGTVVSEADNSAKAAFLRRLMDAERQFQGGIFLGELREALHMIKNPLGSLRKGLREYYQSAKKRTSRVPQKKWRSILGDTWLEYSFGWVPFINDIETGAEALASLQFKDFRKAISAYGTSELQLSNLTKTFAYAYISLEHKFSQVRSAKVIYRGQVAAEPLARRTIGQRFGLRLEEFVPTVWELMPWSFLIDYFTNVGEVLSGWSYGRGNLSWSNKTVIKTEDIKLIAHKINPTSQWQYDWGYFLPPVCHVPPKYHEYSRNVHRDSYTGDFRPSFQWEIPGMRSLKWLNIAALIAGRNYNSRPGRFNPTGI